MRNIPLAPPKPDDLDPEELFRGIRWHQRWEIFEGMFTPGHKPVADILAHAGVPERLDGKTVLDIGPWNGCFGFECARRGASRVLALGPDDPESTGFHKLRAATGLHSVELREGSVYALDRKQVGAFDIVLFFGVLYHLRYPILALDRIYEACDDALYVETFVIDDYFLARDGQGAQAVTTLAAADPRLVSTPLWQFFPGEELQGDRSNWFGPNITAVKDALQSSGFVVRNAYAWGDRVVVGAQKGRRSEFVERCVLPRP